MHAHDRSSRTDAPDERKKAARRAPSDPEGLLALQRSIGNAAVTALLRAEKEPHMHDEGCGHEPSLQRDAVERGLRSPGQPLSSAMLAEKEQQFQADLSEVRIHTGSAAAEAAAAVHAHAFTVGQDIVLPKPDPDVINHELTHAVRNQQQAATGHPTGAGFDMTHPDDGPEREAAANAAHMRSGAHSMVLGNGPGAATAPAATAAPVRRSFGPAPDSALHDRGHAVQRQVFFEHDPIGNILEFQHNTSVRPPWEGSAATLAANAAGQSVNHIIPFERIEHDLTKHLNFLLDNRGQTGWQAHVTAFEANCDALFAPNSPEHTEMVRRRTIIVNLIGGLAQNPTGPQRAPVTTAARRLLSALNSSRHNLRLGNSSLNSSISNAIDADFLTGTFWYTGPVITDSALPAGGNPSAGATWIPAPAGAPAQGTQQVNNVQCVRLTPQHESQVFAYVDASPSSFHFIVSGGAGALHPLAQSGQQMSSTQAPTAVALPGAPLHPVIVVDPTNTKAPHLFA